MDPNQEADIVEIIFKNRDRVRFEDVIGWHFYDIGIFGVVRIDKNKHHYYPTEDIREVMVIAKTEPGVKVFKGVIEYTEKPEEKEGGPDNTN